MPVRSRGLLLAGTVALSGLVLAVAGCHCRPTDNTAYSQAATPASGGFFQSSAPNTSAALPGQTIASSAAVPARPPSPVTLQPVPVAQAQESQGSVIASSWQPVRRVSAEQTVSVPGPTRPIAPSAGGSVVPVRSPVGSTPVGPPGPFLTTGPTVDTNPSAAPPAGAVTLPAPRPLAAPAPGPGGEVVVSGAMMPPHPPGPPMPREFQKQSLPPYVVEPPDMLLVQASPAVTLNIQAIDGQHLVGPDGTINLGIYGRLYVSGMTLDQISDALAQRLLQMMPGLARSLAGKIEKDEKKVKDAAEKERDELLRDQARNWGSTFNTVELIKRELVVDVIGYNSKYYYVITDGGGYGQQVYPFLITGNETVLDAIAKVNGLPAVATKKKIWLARATRPGQPPKIFPVDWRSVAQCGTSETNFQLFPGDRVFVQSDGWIRFDTWLAKRLSPLQRGLGTTLLGASTVNAIKLGSVSGAGAGGLGAFGGVR